MKSTKSISQLPCHSFANVLRGHCQRNWIHSSSRCYPPSRSADNVNRAAFTVHIAVSYTVSGYIYLYSSQTPAHTRASDLWLSADDIQSRMMVTTNAFRPFLLVDNAVPTGAATSCATNPLAESTTSASISNGIHSRSSFSLANKRSELVDNAAIARNSSTLRTSGARSRGEPSTRSYHRWCGRDQHHLAPAPQQ